MSTPRRRRQHHFVAGRRRAEDVEVSSIIYSSLMGDALPHCGYCTRKPTVGLCAQSRGSRSILRCHYSRAHVCRPAPAASGPEPRPSSPRPTSAVVRPIPLTSSLKTSSRAVVPTFCELRHGREMVRELYSKRYRLQDAPTAVHMLYRRPFDLLVQSESRPPQDLPCTTFLDAHDSAELHWRAEKLRRR